MIRFKTITQAEIEKLQTTMENLLKTAINNIGGAFQGPEVLHDYVKVLEAVATWVPCDAPTDKPSAIAIQKGKKAA